MKIKKITDFLFGIEYDYNFNNREIPEMKDIYRNFLKMLLIIVVTTLMCILFRELGFNESNIIMIYILAVLIVATQTSGHLYGITASLVSVLTFNFFFTEPYFSFVANSPEYPVTFIIMLVVAIITSTITARAKREAHISAIKEKRTMFLYEINKCLLKVRNINQVAGAVAENIAKLFERSIIIVTLNQQNELGKEAVYGIKKDPRVMLFSSYDEKKALEKCFILGVQTGAGTEVCKSASTLYTPIVGQNRTLGVIGIACFDNQALNNEQIKLVEAVSTQISFVIERELLYEKQQQSKMDIERERLRSTLLRSISHDLRTPLTGIMGATGTILDNFLLLDDEIKKELLQNIYEDADWLIHTVENILSMTKIDEGRIEINKNQEAVEEIISETLSRVNYLKKDHVLQVNIPEELLLINVDGALIIQVLMNLIDNAVKYTVEGSIIEIKTWVDKNKVYFEVADNGNGIPDEILPYIFDRFYSGKNNIEGVKQGTGLGLAICKAIISAHGGTIEAGNREFKGAFFKFYIPIEEE